MGCVGGEDDEELLLCRLPQHPTLPIYLPTVTYTTVYLGTLAPGRRRAYPHFCALLEWPRPFFFSLPKFQFHSHFLIPLGYSGGISVPTRSLGALVLPLLGPLVSPIPVLELTTPPPKAWACPPALSFTVLHHSHTPSHQTGTASSSSTSEWQREWAESAAATRSSSSSSRSSRAEHRFIIAYLLYRAWAAHGTGVQIVPALACPSLDGTSKQASEQSSQVRPSVIRSTNQPTEPSQASPAVNQAAVDRFINQFTRRSLGLSISQPLNHSFKLPFIPA